MRTSAKIEFDQFDITAKDDGTATCTQLQAWSNPADLMQDELTIPRYISLEDNYTALDGSFDAFPDAPAGEQFGVVTAAMAGADGAFASSPVLTFAFQQNHTSVGVTLHFDPLRYWPREVLAKWFNAAGDVISAALVYPDDVDYFIDNTVEDYRRIELEFSGMNTPYRYLRVTGVEFGTTYKFSGAALTKATLLEELDPISSELPVSTVTATVYSENSDFSILNPKGGFSSLQKRQPLRVYETVDGVETFMGLYYLSEWSCEDENNLTISGVSALGVLDGIRFRGGIYTAYSMGQLVNEILAEAEIDTEIAEEYAAATVTGYIPICTAREALQQIAFAIGAVVDCARNDKVKIYPTPVRPGKTIKKGRKITGQQLKQRDLVTGVKVTAYTYAANAEQTELYNEQLAPGDYEVEFSEPAHSLFATGASILASGANFAVLRVSAEGEVTLNGCGYDVTSAAFRRTGAVPGGASPNVLEVTDATLVNPGNAKAVAARIYEYYQRRYQNSFSIVPGGGETAGDMVLVQSMHGEYLRGFIESMDVDLTGGCIAKLQVTGERIEHSPYPYIGEIHCDDMGVM